MLKKRLTIVIVFIVGFFLLVDFTWYRKSLEQLHVQNTQKQSIIFLSLKVETNHLLNMMMYSFREIREKLLKKHKEVEQFLKDKKDFTELSLDEIYNIINKDLKDKPYDIYITDKNFIIKNTTFKKDLGLDLSFAKDIFLLDYQKDNIGISTPIYESSGKTFFSYTHSFLNYKDKKGNILQVSYNFKNLQESLKRVRKIFERFPSIKEHKCYSISSEHQAYEIILKDYKSYKVDIKEIYDGIKNGKKISKKLENRELYVENILHDNIKYSALYASQTGSIFNDNTQVLHYLLLDESEFEDDLRRLNIIILLITVVGILTIIFFSYFIHKMLIYPILKLQKSIQKKEICSDKQFLSRNDEIGALFRYYNHYYEQIKDILIAKDELLQDKNKFVHNAIHEINTPLSVISTNNSLRDLVQGESQYSINIISAVKTLKNTMDDLNFSIHNTQMIESPTIINLADFIQERVEYFTPIANSSGVSFKLSISTECYILISEIELTRLIDNNLSNAIKYTLVDTEIKINLKKNVDRVSLEFINTGEKIKNREDIFKRFYREHSTKGGFGLGLNIVKDICDKYDIKITTKSENTLNTFTYDIRCHTKVIS